MPLPPPVEALWNELQAVRAEILKEIEGLSQAQADWRPSDRGGDPPVQRAAGDGRPALAQVGAAAVRRTGSRSVVDAPGAARRGPSPATPRGQGCRRLPPGVIPHAVSTA